MLRIWQYEDNTAPKQSGRSSKMLTWATVATPYFYAFNLIYLALLRRQVEDEMARLSAVSEDLTASSHYSFLNFPLIFSLSVSV